ncbi:hypothetical protein [Arenicella xantha]|uniref:Uncharacterized protein n=1 Tax=Arenicella xantha TaxID=644221 RepID=A0A395JQY6_9GAMM|nr:hypothetical protein [Arenicella xantha]RBP51130.1 hypothetical protein DFR28_102549 [Arenicella xantha]
MLSYTITNDAPIELPGGFDQATLVVGQAGSISCLIKNNEPFSITGIEISTNLPIQLDLDTVNSSTICNRSHNIIASVDRCNITDATFAPNSSRSIIIRFITNAVGTASVATAHNFEIILTTVTSDKAASTPAQMSAYRQSLSLSKQLSDKKGIQFFHNTPF